ncbi:dienelactone hydrolase [Salinicola sp. JS01]|uniref:alpha/beta family hydrolase n=1 Tax=Salinicola sp. JS01 TaxID=3050071 RepID=UPI00255BA785|nr:alpha/beta family hydrolase [Salinicola sp. JS01]WIX33545.1 dienelactone hydrolase [Salinicola sp. JS01]
MSIQTDAEPALDAEDHQRIASALAHGDDTLHETALGGVRVCGPAQAPRLLLSHGAGAGHDSPFLSHLRHALAAGGVQVIAVEFAYMARMRREGRRRPPPRVEGLVAELSAWRRAIDADGLAPAWLGGKSMGGRVASLLAAREATPGLVLCGYPFHPPGKPERLRLDHWPDLACPLLLLQGTRDAFGTRAEVESYTLPAQLECHFLEGGDHDWQPPKRLGVSQAALIDTAAALISRRLAPVDRHRG